MSQNSYRANEKDLIEEIKRYKDEINFYKSEVEHFKS